MYKKVIKFLEKYRRIDQVVKLLKRMPEAERGDILQRVFSSRIQFGSEGTLDEVIALFPQAEHKARYEVLVSLSVAAGQFDKAAKLTQEHLKRNLAQCEIVQIVERLYESDFDGTDLENAAQIANHLLGSKWHEWLLKILRKQVANGYFRGADKTALYLRRTLADEELRELYAVAKRKFNIADVIEIGRRLKKDYMKDLNRMLDRCYKQRQWSRARDIVVTMPEPYHTEGLMRIAGQYLEGGQISRAKYTAAMIEDAHWKAVYLGKVLNKFIEKGDLYECAQVVRRYFDRGLNKNELERLLAVCMRKNYVEYVVDIVNSLLALKQS